MRVSTALISVFKKDGIVEFAEGLRNLGVEVISTSGTAKILKENGLDVMTVSELTDSGEILNGRVKTLHPEIFGGILAKRKEKEHLRQLKDISTELIDLVAVNFYPFQNSVRKFDDFESIIENIDIGGPAMVRAAAKNYRDVAVISDPDLYDEVLEKLMENNCSLSESFLQKLAVKAFSLTAKYDQAVANYLGDEFGFKNPR